MGAGTAAVAGSTGIWSRQTATRPFVVVYEELVFATDSTVNDINEYLGDKYIDLDRAFNSHIISGNRDAEQNKDAAGYPV